MPTASTLYRAERGFTGPYPTSAYDVAALTPDELATASIDTLSERLVLATFYKSILDPQYYSSDTIEPIRHLVSANARRSAISSDASALQSRRFRIGMSAVGAMILLRDESSLLGPLVVYQDIDAGHEIWKIGDHSGSYFFACFDEGHLSRASDVEYDISVKTYVDGQEIPREGGNHFVLGLGNDTLTPRDGSAATRSRCEPPPRRATRPPLPAECTQPLGKSYNFRESPVLECSRAQERQLP